MKSVNFIWNTANNHNQGSNIIPHLSNNNRLNMSPFAFMSGFDNNSNLLPLGVSQMIGGGNHNNNRP
jgi:hypothetical protein